MDPAGNGLGLTPWARAPDDDSNPDRTLLCQAHCLHSLLLFASFFSDYFACLACHLVIAEAGDGRDKLGRC
jgi:hypothetical protein